MSLADVRCLQRLPAVQSPRGGKEGTAAATAADAAVLTVQHENNKCGWLAHLGTVFTGGFFLFFSMTKQGFLKQLSTVCIFCFKKHWCCCSPESATQTLSNDLNWSKDTAMSRAQRRLVSKFTTQQISNCEFALFRDLGDTMSERDQVTQSFCFPPNS